MKQVYRDLCTYSADLYGINSALYELGGLIVMHDASGCNSTYNTHDEPRWYTMDSMVYVSGLIEQDAILGNDERLIQDIINVVEKEHPKFVALSRSVLPTYMGTDVRGIAHVIEKRTGVPSFGFQTNGMDTYILGENAAFRAIAERFCRKPEKSSSGNKDGIVRVNIIGVTPLDFSVNGNAELLPETIRSMGYQVQSCWAMGDTLEQLAASPDGNVSLVVSAGGMDAAEYLFQTYGIPFVIGIPCGKTAYENLKEKIAQAASGGNCYSLFSDQPLDPDDPGRKKQRKAYSGGIKIIRPRKKPLTESAGHENIPNIETPVESAAHENIPNIETITSRKSVKPSVSVSERQLQFDREVLLIGEAVHCASIRFQLEQEYGIRQADVLCPLERDAGILRDSDHYDIDEEHIREKINSSRIVIADPVYRRVAGNQVEFFDDPHDAYSGRMYHTQGRIFVGKNAAPFDELRNFC